MKISSDTKIMIISDITEGAYKYQYAYDCVPKTISDLGYSTHTIWSKSLTFDSYRDAISDFGPDLLFCYLQHPSQVIKIAGFLREYHPVPTINWFLEDPNAVVSPENGTNILDATSYFDYWFSQDMKMQRFWKTKSAFIPPAFDDNIYSDFGLQKIYDVSYIGQLGPKIVTEMYWPYMKELAKYGKKAMLCIDRPMGIPLLPKPFEKFVRSKKRRKLLQSLPFWKAGWTNPVDEKGKCRIINQSKIHFGMVRVRGEWEEALKKLLPDYPLDNHGLFYQIKGRLFQAVGGGAMAFNEYCPELENLFEIGREIITFEYGNLEEVKDKLTWYTKNDSERKKIAKAGYESAKKGHTFITRVGQIFDMVRKKL